VPSKIRLIEGAYKRLEVKFKRSITIKKRKLWVKLRNKNNFNIKLTLIKWLNY